MRPLQPGEQPRQRRSQIMGNVVGYPFHLFHQPLDFIQHAIDNLDQAVEVAASPAARQTPAQIAVDDALDRLRDPVDPPERACPGNNGTRKSEDEHHQGTRGHGIAQEVAEPIHIAHVLGHQEDVAGCKPVQHAAKWCRLSVPRQCEIERLVHRRQRRRQGRGSARNPIPVGIEQSDRAAAVRIERRARLQLPHPFAGMRGKPRRHFTLEMLVELAGEVAGGLPIHKPEQDQRRGPEQAQEQQGEPKARRARNVTQTHGEHIPSPGQCGSFATVRLPRACGAAGRYGHR